MGKVFWFVLQGNVPIGQIKLGDLRYNGPQREYLFEMIHGMLNYAKPQRSKVDEVEEVIRLLSHEVGL